MNESGEREKYMNIYSLAPVTAKIELNESQIQIKAGRY